MYRRQCRKLYGLAMLLTGNDHGEAEELVQDTFVRAYEAFSRYSDRGAEGAWLRTICTNLFRERRRRKLMYGARVEPDLQIAAEWASPARGSESNMERLEIQDRILAFVQAMPAAFREVLILRHVQGFSTAEVAETLSIPEGTVRSRLKKARDLVVQQCIRGRIET